jgi:2-(1,2-epoxy-1,2-dihydrophenyl)acetyl-CoA isomerase
MPRKLDQESPPKSEETEMDLSVTGDVATIRFGSSSEFSAIDLSNLDVFPDLVRRAESIPGTRYLVVRGSARCFCSGASPALLQKLMSCGHVYGESIIKRAQRWVLALLHSRLATVASIDGLVAGAGCDLALAFDHRLFGPRTRMNLWYAKLGIIPDLGGLDLLIDRFGRLRALEMYARSTTWTQADVVRLGLGDPMNHSPSDDGEWLPLLEKRLPIEPASFAMAKRFTLSPFLGEFESRQGMAASLQAKLFEKPSVQQRLRKVVALQAARGRR